MPPPSEAAAEPQAVLFDLDDTILDDSSSVGPAWRAVCRRAAQAVAGLDADALLAAIARTRDWYWSDPERHRQGRLDLRTASGYIVDLALRSLGFQRPESALEMGNRYRDLREEAVRPFPGAIETLEALRRRGARLALVTNGSSAGQRAKIERFGLASYFDHILIEGEFGCGKPDGRVYGAALAALGSPPGDAWSVGDNLEWDVAAPQRLGLYGVWVDRSGAGLPQGAVVRPHRTIGSIAELL